MKRKSILLGAGIFILSVFVGSTLKAQQGEPIVVDNVIKVNPRKPPQPSKYFSGTSVKKSKKFKTKTRTLHGWECPSYLSYESKPQKNRYKIIQKRRKNLLASKR